MKRAGAFISIYVLAMMCLGASCQNSIKEAMHGVKYSGAVALVEIDRTIVSGEKAYLKSKEAPEIICKSISDENSNFTDDELKEACYQKIVEVNEDINKGLRASRESLFVLQDCLDAWDYSDAGKKLAIVGAAISALENLMDVLQESECPLPQEVYDYADYLGMLAEMLKEMGQ